jgi:hypothetical protein
LPVLKDGSGNEIASAGKGASDKKKSSVVIGLKLHMNNLFPPVEENGVNVAVCRI